MTTSGNTFGRYTLLGRIAVGGMAEVYRGKFTGEQGFEKPVVIKKMLPQNTSDEQMVQFFIDEARLSALLQHENIVCTYDFGELEGTYFLAMEDLQGHDLHTILKKAADIGSPPGLGNSLWIASKLCNGLEYAHTLKDLAGRPLDIIHRDISPQNVYITYEGNVKILDFGIAKTAMQTTRTRIGIAKGKMAYMSPEQLEAKTIDHRSDIFAVGILLYELVTQSRVYPGDSTTEIFKHVMDAEFEPPENRNPALDPNLAAIINKALQKDPADRFQSCHEMQAAIEDCIFQLSLRPGSNTLSEYLISLFPESYSEGQAPGNSTKNDAPYESGESSYQKTATVGYDNGSMPSDVGTLPSSSSKSGRSSGPQPNVKTANDPNPIKHRRAGLKGMTTAAITVILLTVFFSIVFYFFKQASTSETTPEPLQKAESSIGTTQPTTPEHTGAAVYFYEVSNPDPEGDAVATEYEKIAANYADLAAAAMKQAQYGHAKSLIAKGLELKPEDEQLLGLDRQIKEDLLQKAEYCFKTNRLTTPAQDSAAFYYNEVLKLFPDNDAAKKGDQKIAAKYADFAVNAIKRSQYDKAGSLTAKGLALMPGDERLLGLNQQIKQDLLQKAEECLQENRLTTPAQNSAAFYYNEVLKLFPDSDAAKKGYQKIAAQYADLAEKAMKQFQFDTARFLTVKGLVIKPEDKRLLRLNKRIKQDLLQKAESCIQANQLISPRHDSAVYYYNKVSKLFPDGEAAKKGYDRIAARYADLAENAMKQFQFDKARFLTAQGLELMPDDERLLSLNRQLSSNKVGLFFKNIGKGIKGSDE